jgi:hypothetical protein
MVGQVLLSVDVVARVLGIIGTTAGLVAALIAVLSYRRDQPRLKITWQFEFGNTAVSMQVNVINDGRQPIAVADLELQNFDPAGGLRRRAFRRFGLFRWLNHRGWFNLPEWGGQSIRPTPALLQPRVLRPGDPLDFTFPPDRLRRFVEAHADKRLFLVVTDALGRARTKKLSSGFAELVFRVGPAAEAHNPCRST